MVTPSTQHSAIRLADWLDHLNHECCNSNETYFEAAKTLRDLASQVKRLQADAERYRWLRIGDVQQMDIMEDYYGSELDAAIDEARKQS